LLESIMLAHEQRLLDAFAGNRLAEFYANGGTPEQVRTLLESILGPHFENRDTLDNDVALLIPVAVDLSVAALEAESRALYDAALALQRKAYQRDARASLTVLVESEQSHQDGLTIFWSAFHLQRDRHALELHEYVHETFRTIGVLLEGVAKPVIACLARQAWVASATRGVENPSLGQAMDTIEEATSPGILSVLGIRLNQWRNIAQHFSVNVRSEDAIVVTYGPSNRHSSTLSRNDLEGVLTAVARYFRALKAARSIFFFDHLAEMEALGLLPRAVSIRSDAVLALLVGGLASQGFAAVDIVSAEDESKLVVKDLSSHPWMDRAIHASQFLIPLAQFRPATTLIVEYRDQSDTLRMRATAPLTLVERALACNEIALVAQGAEFVVLHP
jgi:hypothetical protein